MGVTITKAINSDNCAVSSHISESMTNEATGTDFIADIKGASIILKGLKKAEIIARTIPAARAAKKPLSILKKEFETDMMKVDSFISSQSLVTTSNGDGNNTFVLSFSAAIYHTAIQKTSETALVNQTPILLLFLT